MCLLVYQYVSVESLSGPLVGGEGVVVLSTKGIDFTFLELWV